MRKLNIAIIGLGNIGSYLYKYLNKLDKYEIELDKKSSSALSEIDSIKIKIRTNSENLLQVSYSANTLLQDYTTMKPLFESIKATNFANSTFAEIKYDQFGNKTDNLYGWNIEFFKHRTAAEALLLLTDLQFEILNYEMTARSENPDLLDKRSQMMEELTTHK